MNDFWDRIAPTLKPVDALALGHLLRLTVGFDRATCTIGLPKLAKRCGVTVNTVRDAVERLEARGLVRRHEVQANVAIPARGSVFEVTLTPPKTDRVKATRVESTAVAAAPMISDQKEDQSPLVECLRSEAARYRLAYPQANDDVVKARLQAFAGERGWSISEGELAAALQ